MTKSAILDSSLSKLKIYAYFVMEKNKVVLQQKSKNTRLSPLDPFFGWQSSLSPIMLACKSSGQNIHSKLWTVEGTLNSACWNFRTTNATRPSRPACKIIQILFFRRKWKLLKKRNKFHRTFLPKTSKMWIWKDAKGSIFTVKKIKFSFLIFYRFANMPRFLLKNARKR